MLQDHKLTVVGTLRKDKTEVLAELLITKNRERDFSFCLLYNKFQLVSYSPEKSKIVLLVSSVDDRVALGETKNPCQLNITSTLKEVWMFLTNFVRHIPVTEKYSNGHFVFCGTPNAGGINAYKAARNQIAVNHLQFLYNLGEQLVRPHIMRRPMEKPLNSLQGKFDDYLFINIKSNPEPIRIHLLGHGVEPSLEISEQFLDFEATFPFPENYAKYITIRNTGKMPIEIYFTDFDKLVLKEDAALRILCLLYNTSELYLTHEQFSTSLSPKVLDLYDELVKRVPLENNGIEEDTDSSVTVQTQLLLQDDEVRKPSEFSKDVILATDSSLQFELNDIANLHSRIYDYVAAHQEQFVEFLSNIDSQSFFYRETPETEQDQVNEDEIGGDVVIFHGAPSVDYVVWANKAATKLSFVAKTIDEIILQELIDSRSQTAVRVRQLIEEAYFFLVVDNSPDLQAEFTEGKMAVNDDPYYELLRKFDILLMLKEENNKKSAGKKGTAKSTVKSAGTAKKDKKPEYNYAPLLYMDSLTFMNIPLNDFKDILLAGLQKVKGVVIETLHSFFINDTITALLILLISCSYQNVYFVSIFDSVKSFMKRHEEEQKTLEENDRNEKERKINEMDEMSADEFDNLDDDSKKLFRNEKLAERRRIFHNKKIEMKSRPNSKESSKAGKTVEKSKQKKDGTPKSKKEKSQPGTKKSIPKAIADNPVLTEIISKFGAYEKELEIILSVLETWNKHDTVDVNELSKKLSSWNTSSKKNKGETKMTKETSVEVKDTPSNENQSQPENLGIPMWIFNYKKNYCHDIRRFGDCVLQNKSKVEIGHYEGSSFLPKLQSLYLAVKKPDNRVLLLHANEFTIVNVDQASLLGTPETSHLSKSSLVQHSGREKIKQVNQKHSKSPSKSLTMKGGISRRKLIQTPKNSDIVKLDSDTAPGFFQPRVLLEPNQIQTWKICFTPQTFGYFEDEFVIEVARGRKQYTIKCSGICDIPRVDTDPTVIFPLLFEHPMPTGWHILQYKAMALKFDVHNNIIFLLRTAGL
ncbi:uncharacterized protein LOC142320067 [Lycorma delicatula]|uniref:uncharacterized protein LOC142320067 n=1 Tax=Lycorma delicatula TaxID=130591 RepID=UPI003F50E64A